MFRNNFKLIPANGFIWNQKEFTSFLIANQHKPIRINTNSEGVCLNSAGVINQLEQFGFTDVEILTNNLLEQHSTYRIEFSKPFKFFEIQHSNYQPLHTWNLRYKFACLYNRPLWHRIGIAAEMQKYDCALVNLRADPADPNQRQLFELQKLFELAPDSIQAFSQAVIKWPKQIETTDTYTVGNTTTGHTDQLAQYYPDFLIDIVTETWTQGTAFYPTEKTVRPMLLKKPFIIFGSQDYLAYLRQMGFRTFGDFWDETYDGYEGADRYSCILDLIDQLAAKNLDELESMYCDMQYTLDHNYDLLISQKFNHRIEHLK
jgi:hypothetical protein